VLATGVYLRRNDAFASGLLYVGMGALGAPFYAGGASGIVNAGQLIPSAGYLLAFPLASAVVAEGLDRSYRSTKPNVRALLSCWLMAMVPVYVLGTWWLGISYDVSLKQAYEWGTEPFLVWDFAKILVLIALTTKVFSYTKHDP
jgi:biotin transport system substrate-specific component